MGVWIHRLTNVNISLEIADCAFCGPVKIRKSGNVWKCEEGQKLRRSSKRHHRRFCKFGITEKEYEEMHIAQVGLCAICKKPSNFRNLAVDHNHETGKIRGLLCFHCNTGLGFFQDDSELLLKAIQYLKGP